MIQRILRRAVLACFLFTWFPSSGEADVKKPNIILFFIDDMGVMDTSVPFLTDAEGEPKRYPLNDFYRTPNMERLAEMGVRFNNFYAMSVCSPSRVSLLTGQNPAFHRTTNWIRFDQNNAGPLGPPEWNWRGMKSDDVSLQGLLREHGYRTIHIGKGHLGPLGSEGADPANLGFDINIAGSAYGMPGSYRGEDRFGAISGGWPAPVPDLENYHDQDIWLTEALTLEAKEQLTKAVEGERPFFLHFSHYAVHDPFESDPRFAAHYIASGKSADVQAFATLIEGMDKSLGDTLDHLEKLGVAEDTLLIFLGDNGSDAPIGGPHEVAASAPLRGMKGSHYEGGVRTAFIAAWAQPNPDHSLQQRLPIAAGAIQSQVASIEDIFPTLLNLVDVAWPDDHVVEGYPLDTLLAGEADSSRPEQFLMHYPHGPHRSDYWSSWRDGDWKVIYHYVPTEEMAQPYELFNLAEDPAEQHNLASDRPEKLRQMMRGLIDALERRDALYPISKTDGEEMRPKMPAGG